MDIQALSVLPGRARFRIPAIKGNPQLARQWEQRLGEVAGIEHAAANHLTGSLLIRHHPEEVEWERLLRLFFPQQELPEDWESFLVSAAETAAEDLLDHDQAFSNAVHGLIGKLNNAVSSATGVGLRTWIPLTFVVLGIGDLFLSKRTTQPPWFILFAYAVESFARLSPPPDEDEGGNGTAEAGSLEDAG